MRNDIDVARGWLLKAQSDVKTAEIILASDGPTDTACFHAQQAAEKSLKAVLCVNGITPPRTHDLGELVERCAQFDSEFQADEQLLELTEYAVGLRYDFEFWPDKETAVGALERARTVFEKARRIIGETPS